MGSCCQGQKKNKSSDHGTTIQARKQDHNSARREPQRQQAEPSRRQPAEPPKRQPAEPPKQQSAELPKDRSPIEPSAKSQLSAEEQEQRRKQLADAAEERIKNQKVQGFSKAGYIDYQYKKRAAEKAANAPDDQKLLTFKMG